MPEYYYDKHYKKWFDVMNRPNEVLHKSVNKCILDPAVIYDLQHARKTNNFMIVNNKHVQWYFGVHCDYVYIPANQIKLVTTLVNSKGTKERYAYCAYNGKFYSERFRFPIIDVINWKGFLKNFTPDLTYAIEYVEDVNYLDYRTSEEEKMKVRARLYSELDDDAKLFYQLEGKYNFQ